MTENEPIKTVSDGITFLSTGRYYDGINQWIAHSIKEGDTDAIEYAARKMATIVPADAVFVPIPGHHGVADQTLRLVQALSSYTPHPFVDALRGREHKSQYEAKLRGHLLSGRDMGFYQIKELPSGRIPCLIDNVVDTGTTAKAAVEALGNAMVLSFAMSDTLLQREKHIGFKR
jgi:predicted amidophosphoribosyltransferase